MLLTVITSSYNSEKTIERTFNSILQQAVRPLEYIVIDGGSTDQTKLIIKKFEPLFLKEGIIFKWLSESDTGIYNAWNKGLRIANGDYIAAGDSRGYAYCFDRNSSTPLWTYILDEPINSVDISADGNYIVFGSSDKYVYLFTPEDDNPIWRYKTESTVNSVVISSNSE